MYCKSFYLRDFRNIRELELAFDRGVNIFSGRNAQGKTNIVEALWLFSGCKPFRPGTDKDFIRFGKEGCVLKNDFVKNGREIESEIRFFSGKRREIKRNGAKIKTSELVGEFHSVLFFPEHLALIKSGPEERRKFIDFAISQIKPRYYSLTGEYAKVLAQRNFLLKSPRADLRETLDVWDRKLAKLSSIMEATRRSYLEKLNRYAGAVLEDLSGGREKLELQLASYETQKAELAQIEESCYTKLKDALQEDLKAGFTTIGSHRDDVLVSVNGLCAKTYCSQGQQRSCVMALKLGEAEIINEVAEEYPVMLFDDVFSELDALRKAFLTERIRDKQVFITTCEEETPLQNAKVFQIEAGGVKNACF